MMSMVSRIPQIKSWWFAMLWLITICGIIMGLWLLVPTEYQILKLSAIASLMLLVVLPLQTINMPQLPRWLYILIGIVIAVGALVVFVGRVPAPLNYDEGFVAIWANDFYATGNPILPTHTIQTPYYSLYPLGVLLTTLGTSFVNARLSATLLAILSLVPLYFLVVRHFGKSATLFVLVYGVIIAIQQSYVRMDALAPLSIALGMLCFDRANGRFSWYVLSGLFFTSAIESHPLAVVYGLALGIICTLQYIQHIWQRKGFKFSPFWGVLFGAILCLGIYFGIRTLGAGISVETYLQRMDVAFQAEEAIGENMPFPQRVPDIMRLSFEVFINTYPLNFFIITLAMLLVRQIPKIQLWLGVLILGNLVSAFINPKHSFAGYYIVHSLPIVLFLLAGMTHYLQQRLRLFASIALMIVALSFTLAVFIKQMNGFIGEFDFLAQRQLEFGQEIGELLPPEVETVIGWETFYWELHDRQFILSYLFFPSRVGDASVEDVLAQYNLPTPQAIILNRWQDTHLQNLVDYINQHDFELVKCFNTDAIPYLVRLYVLPDILPFTRNIDCP
jgi:hypothetical protein